MTSHSTPSSNSNLVATPESRSPPSIFQQFIDHAMNQTPALARQSLPDDDDERQMFPRRNLGPTNRNLKNAAKSSLKHSIQTLPLNIQATLLEWFEQGREDPPPCAIVSGASHDPYFSTRSQRAIQWTQLPDDQPLTIQKIKWKRIISGKHKTFWLLTARTTKSVPFIIKYRPGGRNELIGLQYSVWLGAEGNEQGFEDEPSVLKRAVGPVQATNSATHCGSEASQDSPKRKPSENLDVQQQLKVKRSKVNAEEAGELLMSDDEPHDFPDATLTTTSTSKARFARSTSSMMNEVGRQIDKWDAKTSISTAASVTAKSEERLSTALPNSASPSQPLVRPMPIIASTGTRYPDFSEWKNYMYQNTFLHFYKGDRVGQILPSSAISDILQRSYCRRLHGETLCTCNCWKAVLEHRQIKNTPSSDDSRY